MKIEIRFEQIGGRECPILFFTDEIERDKSIGAFSEAEGHVQSSRAYLRKCRKPASAFDFSEAWGILERYSRWAQPRQ